MLSSFLTLIALNVLIKHKHNITGVLHRLFCAYKLSQLEKLKSQNVYFGTINLIIRRNELRLTDWQFYVRLPSLFKNLHFVS